MSVPMSYDVPRATVSPIYPAGPFTTGVATQPWTDSAAYPVSEPAFVAPRVPTPYEMAPVQPPVIAAPAIAPPAPPAAAQPASEAASSSAAEDFDYGKAGARFVAPPSAAGFGLIGALYGGTTNGVKGAVTGLVVGAATGALAGLADGWLLGSGISLLGGKPDEDLTGRGAVAGGVIALALLGAQLAIKRTPLSPMMLIPPLLTVAGGAYIGNRLSKLDDPPEPELAPAPFTLPQWQQMPSTLV